VSTLIFSAEQLPGLGFVPDEVTAAHPLRCAAVIFTVTTLVPGCAVPGSVTVGRRSSACAGAVEMAVLVMTAPETRTAAAAARGETWEPTVMVTSPAEQVAVGR
jgi:hypothetical protein